MIRSWIAAYKKAKEIKRKEGVYLASAMSQTNSIMRRW